MPSTPAAQESIASTPITRAASLVGTGVQVGFNYLKHYGKSTVTGRSQREQLHEENARTVYGAFSKLKGGPLKVAQMLSMDQNLLPGPYAREFAQAQYSAPPLSYPLVVRTLRKELGKEPLEIFEQFSEQAAHGASIGQVHRAQRGDHRYAVKVQYPGVADSLRSDLAVVKPLALQVMGVRESDVMPFIREVEERLLEETNYLLELERAQTLAAACQHLSRVRFPVYYPQWCSRRVLTMDWIDGVTLDKFADSDASQAARDAVGQALWDFYEHQVHQLRLFHADPHPGNFLVKEEELWVIDFGCTKRIDDDFYYKNFRFLDPRLLTDRRLLEEALVALQVLLPTDSVRQREEVLEQCVPSLEVLARPFRQGQFDFGSGAFMREIYEMGDASHQRGTWRELRGSRGSPHSIYVNRAYFGLYSLLCRLRARVTTSLPQWLQGVA